MEELGFVEVDAGSEPARAAMAAYFAELDHRFVGGFDATGLLDDGATEMTEPRGRFVLVLRGDDVAGCGGLQFVDDATAEIKRMWIDPAARGIGVGKRLLAHLEDLACATGHATIILDTNGVLTEAIAMYRSAGYEATERYNDNPYAQHWFTKQC